MAHRGIADEIYARELVAYTTNLGDLYRQRVTPIILNLRKKIAKGVYDKDLALKLWLGLATDGAKRYAKEHGTQLVNVATRAATAAKLADYYEDDLRAETWG